MPEMILIVSGVLIVGVWLIPNRIGRRAVRIASQTKYEPMEETAAAAFYQRIHDRVPHHWQQANDFRPIGVYEPSVSDRPVTLAVWRQAEKPTYLVYALVVGQPKPAINFMTLYDGHHRLLTGNIVSTHMLPAVPTAWCQSFSTRSVEKLWTEHERGIKAMRDQQGLSVPDEVSESFVQSFHDLKVQEVAYFRSRRWWWLQAPYWLFIRPFRKHCVPVHKQLQRTASTT